MMPILNLPRLRPDQLAIVKHPAKRKNVAAGRRFGKTVLGGVVVANVLRQHGKAAWVVPTYKNSRPLWRWISSAFAPLAKAKLVNISKADQTIITNQGGFFAIYSEENIDSMRGEWFHVVVNDEAAKFKEESRYDVIEPTVADSDGEIIDISTPRGRNWFWREHQMGLDGGQDRATFHAPTRANPMPAIQKAYLRAQEVLSERSFRQEWDAEFLDESGGVFRKVRQAATAVRNRDHLANTFVMGADFGKHNDFTVLTVIDANLRQMVDMERFNQIDYSVQRSRLKAMYERWKPISIVAERNSIGDPIIEQLQLEGLPVQPFTTTNSSKAQIIDGLALAFERDQIQIFDDPVLLNELMSYEMERLPSGMLRYSAPDGSHDDCVMSLAMCWYGASQMVSSPELANAFAWN